ncbi:phosphoglycerate dehydrogenase [Neobacillus sp. 3P2-tot-E-2]|uniref:phosphoglycerate dehydrogenase n=1 Tax=Neobacillus sp. 3P2-tot-E-2 TaxID=3132212 RepID=UPI0039A2B2A4
MKKVVSLARSFAKLSDEPIRLLENAGFIVEIKRNHQVYDEEIIASLIGEADACIVGSDKIGSIVFEKCPNLKVVSKHGVGLNNIDLALAKQQGIIVTNTPGANSQSTAELAWSLLMAANRNLYNEARGIKENKGDYKASVLQNDLHIKTLGIIGFGQIGETIARIGKAFCMEIKAYDPFKSLGIVEKDYGIVEMVSLDKLFESSDFISVHAPATKENHHMINKATISTMKDGVIIVNTARGELICEDDLYEALISGKVKAAGLDVFEGEPPLNNKLLELENVIATPHIGGQSIQSSIKLGIQAAQNVIKYLSIVETK